MGELGPRDAVFCGEGGTEMICDVNNGDEKEKLAQIDAKLGDVMEELDVVRDRLRQMDKAFISLLQTLVPHIGTDSAQWVADMHGELEDDE